MSELVQQMRFRGAPHEADTPALQVHEVTVAYPAAPRAYALDGVTFAAEAGEQIAIIGPNGAGKSTLLKVVAGLIRPDSGRVAMFGHPPDAHICIAYVPQRSEIDWRFPVTVADVVMMGRTKQIGLFRRPSAADRAIVEASLARVQAADLADKQIGALSGGQQQRVFIARALALETDLMLLDEPFSGLDVPSQEAILAILADLRPDGVTVLVSTHDLNLAAEQFDQVILLNRRIVAMGPAAAVLTPERLLTAFGANSVGGESER